MAGIYIHIPFCKRKCVYCDFYSTALFGKYSLSFLDAAVRELEASKGYIRGEAVTTLYFGGGTPSLYPARGIGKLVGAVRDIYGAGEISEITLEANPEDIDQEYLCGLVDAGVNRLSIGVQSFDDGVLSFMKRRHDGAKAESSIEAARRAGLANITIDLIYGIPGLDLGLWAKTLDRAVSLSPEHISAYHLTVEPGTALGRRYSAGTLAEVPQDKSEAQFRLLREKLLSSGYEHYEVSNFAKKGFRSRHNSSYWTGEKYLGIGPGAHSFDGVSRRWCGMSVADYVAAEKILYGCEILSPDDRYNELVMTSLRCTDGVTESKIGETAGEKYLMHFSLAADGLLRRGLLQREGNRYYIDPRDFLISDSIISSLFI